MTRRDALRLLPAVFTLSAFQQKSAALKPFKVDIPQTVINRILARVKSARLPDRIDGTRDWSYGANWDYMKSLADYWTTQFDWKKAQANLNRYPQFTTRVEDYDIHFYYVKGKGPKPMPVVFTHGWPGSVFEFIEAIGPLSDPASHGGSAEDAFDVVVPSIPGFGFSSKPKQPIGPPTTARLWHKLMTDVLGYSKFGAQGGDWGNAITLALARDFPQSLAGIHLNAAGAAAPQQSNLSDEEKEWQQVTTAYRAQELDYFNEQQHKPETVAFALYDNPLGAAAWIVEKFKVWSDSGNDIESAFTKDQLLTNVMIYLVTDTVATAVWFYRGALDDRAAPARGKVETPVGFASFPGEMRPLNPPRTLLERSFNLVQYTRMPKGGHFACLEQPRLFVDDVRSFFRKVR
jgi:pimeloyl-ACP methyl ester carboxylesterase